MPKEQQTSAHQVDVVGRVQKTESVETAVSGFYELQSGMPQAVNGNLHPGETGEPERYIPHFLVSQDTGRVRIDGERLIKFSTPRINPQFKILLDLLESGGIGLSQYELAKILTVMKADVSPNVVMGRLTQTLESKGRPTILKRSRDEERGFVYSIPFSKVEFGKIEESEKSPPTPKSKEDREGQGNDLKASKDDSDIQIKGRNIVRKARSQANGRLSELEEQQIEDIRINASIALLSFLANPPDQIAPLKSDDFLKSFLPSSLLSGGMGKFSPKKITELRKYDEFKKGKFISEAFAKIVERYWDTDENSSELGERERKIIRLLNEIRLGKKHEDDLVSQTKPAEEDEAPGLKHDKPEIIRAVYSHFGIDVPEQYDGAPITEDLQVVRLTGKARRRNPRVEGDSV